jgi:hypothetical protein
MARWADPARRAAAAPLCRDLMLANTLDRNVDGIIAVYEEVVANQRRGRRAA